MNKDDLSQDFDARFREQALEEQRRKSMIPNGPQVEDCVECGDQIPEKRIAAYRGCIRCACCQEEFEHGRKN